MQPSSGLTQPQALIAPTVTPRLRFTLLIALLLLSVAVLLTWLLRAQPFSATPAAAAQATPAAAAAALPVVLGAALGPRLLRW